ncbi:LEA type 2 family protein [Candidatus Woesearchaeota archaeon]|nr:LEA type 2 family protein [Candidatus Woesearchaeota archaeon]
MGLLKTVLLCALGLVIALGAVGYYQYSLIEQIDAQIVSSSVKDLSLSGATLVFTMAITNPSAVTLDVQRLHLELYAQGVHVGDIDSSEQLLLAAGETVRRDFELKVRFADLGQSLLKALQQGSVDWEIHGLADIKFFGFMYQHSFAIKKE